MKKKKLDTFEKKKSKSNRYQFEKFYIIGIEARQIMIIRDYARGADAKSRHNYYKNKNNRHFLHQIRYILCEINYVN